MSSFNWAYKSISQHPAILCLLKIGRPGLWILAQYKALSNMALTWIFLCSNPCSFGPPLDPFCLDHNHILVGHGVVLLFCWPCEGPCGRTMKFLLYFWLLIRYKLHSSLLIISSCHVYYWMCNMKEFITLLTWWVVLSCLDFIFGLKHWDSGIQSLYSRMYCWVHEHNSQVE